MPVLTSSSIEYISRSTEHTRRVGMRLGTLLQSGDVICLEGDLGSGKTTLVQGISVGWGSLDLASSPTFVLVNVYRRPDEGRLFHLDAYRLSNTTEAEELDLDAMLGQGPLVIEWADRIRAVLPVDHLWIRLRWVEIDQRDLMISAKGERYQRLLTDFRRQVFGAA
jgi:tRNA threonylcarbamoyladenosine biosynthesis protein TsaE